MIKTTVVLAVAAALALSAGVTAHEGHHHQAMGTIEAVDTQTLTLAMHEDKSEIFTLTEETSFTRGDDEVERQDMTVGERAVVMYETKDKTHVAIEVKLRPKQE